MTAPLVPCATCARHLFADAAECPFCHSPRAPQDLAYLPLPRMSRSAMAAIGVALIVPAALLLAPPDEADAQSHGPPSHRPLYGMPPRPHPTPLPDAGVAHPDAGTAHPDAGTARPDAGTARRDAGRRPPPPRLHDYDLNQPMYGLPPD